MSQILAIDELKKHFPIRNVWKRRVGWLKALDGVSLSVEKGEILGVVGESGCGKSTPGKTLMGIHPPTSGRIVFNGKDIAGLKPYQARDLRRELQYTYQDPGASLDPRWKIGRSLDEPLAVHTNLDRKARRASGKSWTRSGCRKATSTSTRTRSRAASSAASASPAFLRCTLRWSCSTSRRRASTSRCRRRSSTSFSTCRSSST